MGNKTSGTKPSFLKSTIPGADELNYNNSEIQSGLNTLSKTNSQPSQPPVVAPQQPRQMSEEEQLASLSSPQEENVNDVDMNGIDSSGRPFPTPIANKEESAANIADLVEGGIPTAVQAIGTVGGGIAGSVIPGYGTGVGARAGSALASSVNVALAPAFRDLADKVRNHFGIPKSDKSDFEARLTALVGETIGNFIPTIKNNAKYAADYVGSKLAKEEGSLVAENIATMNKLKDQGIPTNTTGLFKGTQFDQDVINMKDQPNLTDAQKAFHEFADAKGSQIGKDGKAILSDENTSKQLDDVGKNIGIKRRQIESIIGDDTRDPAVYLQVAKEAFERQGIKTVNGEIPEEIMKTLSGEQRALAIKHNSFVQKIKNIHIEGNTGTTLSAEQMKHIQQPVPVKPNFNGATDPNAAAHFQDALATGEQNVVRGESPNSITVTTQEEGRSIPGITEVGTKTTPISGTQGSLGLAEQGDILNQVVATSENGTPITRAEVLAKNSRVKVFENEGVTTRGISAKEIHDQTQNFQKLANFDSKSRTTTDKAFGEISNTLATMRDEMTRDAYKIAEERATASGDTESAEMFRDGAEQMKNLNNRYSLLANSQKKFVEALKKKPDEAVNMIMKTMSHDQFSSLVKGSGDETVGALRNLYTKNLISDSSSGGVLMNPETMRKRIYNDGERVGILFGKYGKEALDSLINLAENSIKMDKSISEGAGRSNIIKKANGFIKELGNTGLDLADRLFARSPNIKRAIQDSPEYISSFQRYYGSGSPSNVAEMSAPLIKGSVATKSLSTAKDMKASTRRQDEQDKQLKMLDLGM